VDTGALCGALAAGRLWGAGLDVTDPEPLPPGHPLRVIGIRHGEKMHETLLSAEEMTKASDEGEFFRVPLDARGLQYELYFDDGHSTPELEAFTSENARRLDVAETKRLLVALPEIQAALEGAGGGASA